MLEARDVVKRVIFVPPFIGQDRYIKLFDVLDLQLGFQLGRDFFTFPYDWRQDIRRSARQLAEFIRQLRAKYGIDSHFQVLAHSMGGVVARYYINCLGGHAHVKRLTVMGTPHLGVPKSFQSMVEGVEVPIVKIRPEKFRKILLTFPSLYQILPSYPFVYHANGSPIDIYAQKDWLKPRYHTLLAYGLAFHRELGSGCKVPMVCLVGYGQRTLVQANIKGHSPWVFEYVDRPEGDTTIPEKSALAQGRNVESPAFTTKPHGLLFDDEVVHHWLSFQLFHRYVEAERGMKRSLDQIPLSAKGVALSLTVTPEIALPGQDLSLSLLVHQDGSAVTGLRVTGDWDNWQGGKVIFAEGEPGTYTAMVQSPIEEENYVLRVRASDPEVGEIETGAFLAVSDAAKED